MTSNVRIDIASEFSDKGFKAAEKATSHLDKSIAKLSKRLTGAFSAYKIAQFGKESVKAFAADQKAAAVLAKTLENVNQGYATDMVENYIHRTEALYGVLDDKLRPAFAQLVVATGDASKSQKLLQTALDVSAGTGKDLESVTAALSKAYLGNVTALQRLGVGLSKADLAGKSFDQIITILNQNFSGQAATAADTYGGKIDRLNVAFENMKETIGKGIIDAFGKLNTDQGFNGVIDKMGSLAQDISDIILGIGVVAQKLQSLPGIGVLGDILKFNIDHGLLGLLKNLGATERNKSSQPSVVTNFMSDMKKIAAATAKANDQSKKLLTTSKALTKEAKDKLALDKASLELKRASSVFDMDQIELAAASMAKQTDEDYARIKLKKDLIDLQKAIDAGDAATATKLAAIVEEDYKRVWAYQQQNIALGIQNGTIANIKNAADLIPKDLNLINLDNLNAALAAINAMIAALGKLTMPSINPLAPSTSTNPNANNPFVYPAGKAPTGISSGTYLNQTVRCPICGMDVPADKLDQHIATVHPAVLNGATNVLNSNTTALSAALNSGFFDMAFNAAEFSGANINPYQLTDAQAAAYNAAQNVKITIVDNTSGLIQVVTDATQQGSANGINTRLVRNSTGLDW